MIIAVLSPGKTLWMTLATPTGGLMTDTTRAGDKDLSVKTMHYIELCKLLIFSKILVLDFTT